MITNIQNQIKVKRVQNIEQKFSKATDKMLALSGMNGYESTENFVAELKNHLKIAKICDNNHLNECWSYNKIKLKDDKEWEIAKTKNWRSLKLTKDDTNNWDNTVGIVTADGTSMILSYNTKCNMSYNSTPNWTENKSTSADCVAAIYDWNGGRKPNMYDHSDSKHIKKSDVQTFNAGGIGYSCAVEVNDRCFQLPSSIPPAKATEYGYTWCTGQETQKWATPSVGEAKRLGIKQCYFLNDYWNAAVVKCNGTKNMPTQSDLEQIANLLYETDVFTNSGIKNYKYATLNQSIATSLGLKTPPFHIWSGVESSNTMVYHRYFESGRSYYTNYYYSERYYGGHSDRSGLKYAMCADD